MRSTRRALSTRGAVRWVRSWWCVRTHGSGIHGWRVSVRRPGRVWVTWGIVTVFVATWIKWCDWVTGCPVPWTDCGCQLASTVGINDTSASRGSVGGVPVTMVYFQMAVILSGRTRPAPQTSLSASAVPSHRRKSEVAICLARIVTASVS